MGLCLKSKSQVQSCKHCVWWCFMTGQPQKLSLCPPRRDAVQTVVKNVPSYTFSKLNCVLEVYIFIDFTYVNTRYIRMNYKQVMLLACSQSGTSIVKTI